MESSTCSGSSTITTPFTSVSTTPFPLIDMTSGSSSACTCYLPPIGQDQQSFLRTPPPPRNHDITHAAYISRWSHKPDIVYLDHGAFGGCPKEVQEVQTAIRTAVESDPHDFFERRYPSALQESKRALARFLNCDVDGLVLLPGATHAMNVVINSQTYEPGDEILTTNHAYSSMKMALDSSALQYGARVVVAEVPFPVDSDQQLIDSIMSCVTDKTRFAVIDHLPSRSAIIFPVKQIVKLLTDRGIETLVDGAHAPGMIELDIAEINAPYYVANCHKWMCSPRGIGFIHVRHDRFDHVKPLVVARSPHMVNRDKHTSLQHKFDWLGTTDPSAYLSLPATIKFLETIVPGGYKGLVKRNHDMTIEARKIICDKLNIPIPCPEHMIGCMATFPLPDINGPAGEGMLPIQRTLYHTFKTELPVYAWPSHPKRVFRISCQTFNFLEQYSWVADILSHLLGRENPTIDNSPQSQLEPPSPPPSPPCGDQDSSSDDNDKFNPSGKGSKQKSGNRTSTSGGTTITTLNSATNFNFNLNNFGKHLPHPELKIAPISVQGCVDPYVTSQPTKSRRNLSAVELENASYTTLELLALFRVSSLVRDSPTAPSPPVLYPTSDSSGDSPSINHSASFFRQYESEHARIARLLSSYRERGLPASCAPPVQSALLKPSILDEWPHISPDVAHCAARAGAALIAHATPANAATDKKSFACNVVPYTTHTGATNLSLCLWNAALMEAAVDLRADDLSRVESFLQIHAFVKDPISGLGRGCFKSQARIFAGLLSRVDTGSGRMKMAFGAWQAVAAQLAAESSFLNIRKLQKVSHVCVVGVQQLTYVYVTLDKLRRAEFSLPKRVLELVQEFLNVAALTNEDGHGIAIAPLTVAYCHHLSTRKPFKTIIDGNNRATTLVLLRFLASHLSELRHISEPHHIPSKSQLPTANPGPLTADAAVPALARYCRRHGLCRKWHIDVHDALLALLACEVTKRCVIENARSGVLDRRFGSVDRVPALVVQEENFHTVWVGAGRMAGEAGEGGVGGRRTKRRATLLQPVQQAVFADRELNLVIPAKMQSHGRSLGFKALPVKCAV